MIVLIGLFAVKVKAADTSSVILSDLANNTELWRARSVFRDLKQRKLRAVEMSELEKYAREGEHQIQQLSSLLLTYKHLEAGFGLSTLPDYLQTNLVVALRNDDINPRHYALPPNCDYAAYILRNNPYGPELKKLLYRELTGPDIQSARMASRILAQWHNPEKLADDRLNDFLISDLTDNLSSHFFGVWARIDSLGRKNLQHILLKGDTYTEFQCAVLQILCAKHDIEWSPPASIIEQWISICESEKAQDYFLRNRVRQAAIYLNPIAASQKDKSGFPKRTRQLFEKEGRMALASGAEKFAWLRTWVLSFPE